MTAVQCLYQLQPGAGTVCNSRHVRPTCRTMRILLRALLIGSVLAAALVSNAFAASTEKPIRVLIVDGFSNHDWRLTTHYIRSILERAGNFAVDVSTAPPTSSAPG